MQFVFLELPISTLSTQQVEDISKEPHVERELMLIKLHADADTRAEVMYCYEAGIHSLGVAKLLYELLKLSAQVIWKSFS